jgi:hypothetical protein
MPVRFDGFQSNQQHSMQRAFDLMKAASAKARRSLFDGDLTAYAKWFEAGGTAHLMKVASIVKDVDEAINTRPITFAPLDRPGVQMNTSGLCAHVFLIKDGKHLVHAGSGMRVMVVWKTHVGEPVKYLAQTMYHELTHKVSSTDDHNYSEHTCAQYAKTSPATAVTNAENFNLFLREYL